MKKILGGCIPLMLLLVFASFTPPQTNSMVSARLKVQKVSNGKKIVIEADVLYHIDKKEISIHYSYPEEFVFVSNILGETKIYFPRKNEVMLQNNDVLSADTDILFLFFNQNMSEMGLKNLGFELVSSENKENYHITRWVPPHKIENIAEVELVFEDYIPIYTSFISQKHETVSKTYYSDYRYFNDHFIPLQVTEITYLSATDSIVSRKNYSDLKYGTQIRSDLVNFEIPFDAKAIK